MITAPLTPTQAFRRRSTRATAAAQQHQGDAGASLDVARATEPQNLSTVRMFGEPPRKRLLEHGPGFRSVSSAMNDPQAALAVAHGLREFRTNPKPGLLGHQAVEIDASLPLDLAPAHATQLGGVHAGGRTRDLLAHDFEGELYGGCRLR